MLRNEIPSAESFEDGDIDVLTVIARRLLEGATEGKPPGDDDDYVLGAMLLRRSRRKELMSVRKFMEQYGDTVERIKPPFVHPYFTLNHETQTIEANGHTEHLPPTEYRLLKDLTTYTNTIRTTQQLMDHAFISDTDTRTDNHLAVYIKRLRSKIEKLWKNTHTPVDSKDIITTHRQIGYKLVSPQGRRPLQAVPRQ